MGKLVCVVEMDKVTGAKVTVTDEASGASQTLHMDGAKLTITVKGGGKTSTVEQTPGRIFLQAETIELDAQTLKMTSKTGTWDSTTIKATATQDLKLVSQGTLSASATSDLSLEGLNAAMKARTAARVEGMTLALKGSTSLQMEGMSAGLKGTQVQVEGTMVAVKGTAQLSCEAAGQATFKGAMCQIAGALISIG